MDEQSEADVAKQWARESVATILMFEEAIAEIWSALGLPHLAEAQRRVAHDLRCERETVAGLLAGHASR